MASQLTGRRVLGGAIALTAIACVVAIYGGAGGVAMAQNESPEDTPATLSGNNPPGDAFLLDFRGGYDEDLHWLADYVMDAPWFGTGYSARNVLFDRSGMTLKLQRRRIGRQPYTGAEFQAHGFYGYGRYEAVMRGPDQSGSVASFFTHTDPYFGDPHDEIDFELLGRNPYEVHINYFHKGKQMGTVPIPLPFNAAKDFHLYAFEWAPDSIRWYVDNELVHEVTSRNSRIGIPRATGRVIANIWAAKGGAVRWTGDAKFRTVKASYRCISHVPMGEDGPQCSDDYRPPRSK